MNKKIIVASAIGTAIVLGAGGAAIAGTQADDSERDNAITGSALDQASAAAIDAAGGGRVTETSVNDEEAKYDVEITLDNGDHVDVLLDANFSVIGQETDQANDNEASTGESANEYSTGSADETAAESADGTDGGHADQEGVDVNHEAGPEEQ